MADVLGSCELKHPIEVRGERTSRIEVRRRPCLGDMAELERRGLVDGLDIRDDAQYRATIYLAQQLCGLTASEAESLDLKEDVLAVFAMFRPFVTADSPRTGGK